MIKPNTYSTCTEFYEVAMSVELVRLYGGEDRKFRIDALHDQKTGKYSTSAYIQEAVTLQPSFPVIDGKYPPLKSYSIWVSFPGIGWTERDSAEAAVEQALGFLV